MIIRITPIEINGAATIATMDDSLILAFSIQWNYNNGNPISFGKNQDSKVWYVVKYLWDSLLLRNS